MMKTGANRAGSSVSPDLLRRDTALGEAPASALQWALTACVAVLTFVAIDMISERLAKGPRYRLRAVEVFAIGSAPLHMDRFLAGQESSRLGSHSILDPDLESKVNEVLRVRPWVAEVRTVFRSFPDRAVLAVALREPMARIRIGGEDFILDSSAVALKPLGDEDEVPWIRLLGSGMPLRALQGQSLATTPAGEAMEVLKAIRRIGDHPALSSHRILELAIGRDGHHRASGDSDVVLTLDQGTRVRWGRSPTAALASIEPAPEKKLDALAGVIRRFPGLVGVGLVDLRFRDPEVFVPSR
jgi:cell division septal protein FtsQ